jgi:glycosyltransferase involved in cell wall biosynthesis
MAVQESMARRRLVVAAYADPLKRDYVNGEPFSPYLVSGGDAETIASLVAHYVTHDADRRRLVDRAYEHARTLSWKRTAGEYLKLWAAAPRRQDRLRSFRNRASLAWKFATEAHTPASAWQV